MNKVVHDSLKFLRDRFNLSADQEREDKIIQEIRRGVEFRGVNVWVLVFAIMIASIGLNVNSAAVVIGAMLISPLMGPIMGIGVGLGISDVDLIRKASKNLAVMVAISVITSWIYFFVSPLSDAQSELLSRTTPTIWDVFIGFFGGLAGIVAIASKERGNVIPGVAIATALMPPLCTAGYGLAIGSIPYFAGAFYLFSINAVFICFSTLLIVRFLRFHEVAFVSPDMKRRVRTIIAVFIIAMITPSIYIARNLVIKSIQKNRIENYMKTAFDFPATEVLKHEIVDKDGVQTLEVSLMGSPLDANTITNLENQLPGFGLDNMKLLIKQGPKNLSAADIKSQVLEQFLASSLDSLKSKDEQISYLSKELIKSKRQFIPMYQISREAAFFDENIEKISIESAVFYNNVGTPVDTIHLALTQFIKTPDEKNLIRFQNWLKERIGTDSVRVVLEPNE